MRRGITRRTVLLTEAGAAFLLGTALVCFRQDVLRGLVELLHLRRIAIVTTSDGVPVANSRVTIARIGPSQAIVDHVGPRWTDDDGVVSLEGIDRGDHRVTIWYNHHQRGSIPVVVSMATSTGPWQPETVELQVAVENAIRLQVLSYRGQRPDYGVIKYAFVEQFLGVGQENFHEVDYRRPGKVFLAGLPYKGNLYLTTRGHDRIDGARRPVVTPTYTEAAVRLEDIQPPGDVVLRLEGSWFTSVRVAGADVGPLSGVFATVGSRHVRLPPELPYIEHTKAFPARHPYEHLGSQSLVAPRGGVAGEYDLFVFEGLDEPIGLFHQDGAAMIARSRLEALLAGPSPKTIRLGVEGFVAGTVQNSRGEPVSRCWVELMLAGGEKRSAETFSNGNFFLYAGDAEPLRLEIRPVNGEGLTIESPSVGAMEIVRVE